MAELGADNLKQKADASNAVSGPTTNIDLRADLMSGSTGINRFSFYRPIPISLDGNLLCALSLPPANDRKLGDYRRYNHTSLTPSIYYNPAMLKWYIGTGTFQFIISVKPERMNLYELSNNDPMYWKTIYYLSSSDRASEINAHGSHTDTTDILTTESPAAPAGHTSNQTVSPVTSQMLFTDPAFDPTGLTTPSDVVYCDTFIVNSGGTRIIRVGTAVSDSYLDVTFTQVSAPYHQKTGPYVVGAPPGYTVVIPVVTTGSSSYLGANQVYTNGDSTYDTWWYLAGLKGSTWYRLGTVSAVATITGVGSTTTILSGALTAAGSASNEHDTGTLASSALWNTGEIGLLNVTVASWTGVTEYALAGYPG